LPGCKNYNSKGGNPKTRVFSIGEEKLGRKPTPKNMTRKVDSLLTLTLTKRGSFLSICEASRLRK
tara:strand:+ start:341 stop:535 length:195 start_codon:yes stop_codon:yes gene_type:complete